MVYSDPLCYAYFFCLITSCTFHIWTYWIRYCIATSQDCFYIRQQTKKIFSMCFFFTLKIFFAWVFIKLLRLIWLRWKYIDVVFYFVFIRFLLSPHHSDWFMHFTIGIFIYSYFSFQVLWRRNLYRQSQHPVCLGKKCSPYQTPQRYLWDLLDSLTLSCLISDSKVLFVICPFQQLWTMFRSAVPH